MYKKVFFLLVIVISLLFLVGVVSASEVDNVASKNTSSSTNSINLTIKNSTSELLSTSYKYPNLKNKVQISKSKSIFKAGTKIKIVVQTDNSVKKISGSIKGKTTQIFKKHKNGYWYSYLKTKGYKTGTYSFNVKAVDNKKKIYRNSTQLKVDNIPPKVFSLKSSAKTVTAGTPFYLENIADKSSKKVVAKVNGKTFKFVLNPTSNKTTNMKNWTLNAKINYKVLGNLKINVYTYDSAGNYIKKTINIKSVPRYVFWDGTVLYSKPVKVYYSNPVNIYQKSINILSKYVNVYEGYAGNSYTLGITYIFNAKAQRVIIAYKDPFVVYHEMGHVLNVKWNEYKCDLYAYKKTGYWIL
jgi:hypothetical protein